MRHGIRREEPSVTLRRKAPATRETRARQLPRRIHAQWYPTHGYQSDPSSQQASCRIPSGHCHSSIQLNAQDLRRAAISGVSLPARTRACEAASRSHRPSGDGAHAVRGRARGVHADAGRGQYASRGAEQARLANGVVVELGGFDMRHVGQVLGGCGVPARRRPECVPAPRAGGLPAIAPRGVVTREPWRSMRCGWTLSPNARTCSPMASRVALNVESTAVSRPSQYDV